jgi:hypothetical protein
MRAWMLASAAAAVLVVLLGGCGGSDNGSGEAPADSGAPYGAQTEDGPAAYEPRPYRPDPAEEYANGKRLAARMAQKALTYEPGASAREVASTLPRTEAGVASLAAALEPAVDPERRSVGEVVYPQLSGVTPTSLGAMVITRQVLEDAHGERESLTRVLDVRLRLSGQSWALDRIASVGGSPVPRPASLAAAAERVLEEPNISLSDSARWDIYRGSVDPTLLDALATAARRHQLSVGILRSGHPPNVWATERPSAHSQGFAADIYAVDGRPVVRQQRTASPAYELAEELFAGGAYQLGSPWAFGAGVGSSFTDAVHQDHIHLQQAPVT